MEELNVLRERTRRHIALNGNSRNFRLAGTSTGNEITLCLFDISFSGGNSGGLCRFLCLFFQTHFLHLAMGNRHHGFIETVNGWIIIPIQRTVKFQLFFRERTELLGGNVFDNNARFRFGSILCLFWLRLRFADRLQFSKEVVCKQTRVGIV